MSSREHQQRVAQAQRAAAQKVQEAVLTAAEQRGHRQATAWAGGGAAAGAMLGSFLGPIGALVGGAIGALVGHEVGAEKDAATNKENV